MRQRRHPRKSVPPRYLPSSNHAGNHAIDGHVNNSHDNEDIDPIDLDDEIIDATTSPENDVQAPAKSESITDDTSPLTARTFEDSEDPSGAVDSGGSGGSGAGVVGRFVIRREVKLRLDVYLQRRLKGMSRSRIQKLIELSAVTVNRRRAKPSLVLHRGDEVAVSLPRQAARIIEPQPIDLDILYEDDALLVINKQAGLVIHPARSHLSGTLVNGLAHYFQQKHHAAGGVMLPRRTRGFRKSDQPRAKSSDQGPVTQKNATLSPQPSRTPKNPDLPGDPRNPKDPEVAGDPKVAADQRNPEDLGVPGLSGVGAAEFRPGIVHRLDKNTTGALVVAKNDSAHWAIARQFAERTTIKAYLAIVHGNFDTVGGVLEFPIGKHPTIREAYAVRYDSAAKPAVTLYRVREQYRGYSLVELELKTGRTHQIRVHLSYLGYPIVGDIVYGGEPIGQPELDHPPLAAGSRSMLTFARDKDQGLKIEGQSLLRSDLILAHPALHAAMLSFVHPVTETRVTFTAPLHEPMAGLITSLRQRPINKPVSNDGCWVELA